MSSLVTNLNSSTAQKIVNWVTTAGGCVHTADATQLDSSASAVCIGLYSLEDSSLYRLTVCTGESWLDIIPLSLTHGQKVLKSSFAANRVISLCKFLDKNGDLRPRLRICLALCLQAYSWVDGICGSGQSGPVENGGMENARVDLSARYVKGGQCGRKQENPANSKSKVSARQQCVCGGRYSEEIKAQSKIPR